MNDDHRRRRTDRALAIRDHALTIFRQLGIPEEISGQAGATWDNGQFFVLRWNDDTGEPRNVLDIFVQGPERQKIFSMRWSVPAGVGATMHQERVVCFKRGPWEDAFLGTRGAPKAIDPCQRLVEPVTLDTRVTGLLVSESLRISLVIDGQGLTAQLPAAEARNFAAVLAKLADQHEAGEHVCAVNGATAWAHGVAGNA
jgi:hypothetical protein